MLDRAGLGWVATECRSTIEIGKTPENALDGQVEVINQLIDSRSIPEPVEEQEGEIEIDWEGGDQTDKPWPKFQRDEQIGIALDVFDGLVIKTVLNLEQSKKNLAEIGGDGVLSLQLDIGDDKPEEVDIQPAASAVREFVELRGEIAEWLLSGTDEDGGELS